MVKENLHGLMGMYMKVNLKMVIRMVQDYLRGQMDQLMRELEGE